MTKEEMQAIMAAIHQRQKEEYLKQQQQHSSFSTRSLFFGYPEQLLPLCPLDPKGGESNVKVMFAKSALGRDLGAPPVIIEIFITIFNRFFLFIYGIN